VSGGADALNGTLDVSVTGSAATATTAANLSGTPALPNGTTATTQAVADNSAKLATTAYTDRAVAGVAGSNPTGTIGDTFQIGTLASGPKLKRNGTGLDLRNSGDTAYEELTVQRVKSPSGTTFEAGGLFESTPTVLIPTLFFNDAVKLPQFMDAVSAIPVGTMVKIPVLDPGNDHKVITNIPGTGDPLRQQIDCSWLSGVGTGCSGTLPVASATLPSMDGVASAGSGTGYSLPNHVHPSDTSRVPTTRTVNGQALSADITITTPRNIAVATFVGGGSALTAGSTPGVSLIYSPPVVAACTATSWTITVDAGTAGFRVWRAAAGTANPTVTESIVPSSDLAISTGTTLTSTTFTNFSNGTAPVFAVGDRIAVRLATVATATYAQFSIQCQ
jgi:hypothetical protein